MVSEYPQVSNGSCGAKICFKVASTSLPGSLWKDDRFYISFDVFFPWLMIYILTYNVKGLCQNSSDLIAQVESDTNQITNNKKGEKNEYIRFTRFNRECSRSTSLVVIAILMCTCIEVEVKLQDLSFFLSSSQNTNASFYQRSRCWDLIYTSKSFLVSKVAVDHIFLCGYQLSMCVDRNGPLVPLRRLQQVIF